MFFVSDNVAIRWPQRCKCKDDMHEYINWLVILVCVVGKLHGNMLIKRIENSTDSAVIDKHWYSRSPLQSVSWKDCSLRLIFSYYLNGYIWKEWLKFSLRTLNILYIVLGKVNNYQHWLEILVFFTCLDAGEENEHTPSNLLGLIKLLWSL